MKKFSFTFGILFAIFVVFVIPFFVQATSHDPYGTRATADEARLATNQGTVSAVAGKVIGTGLTLVGVLFFLLMIYAGISWMLARGNEEQSKKALNTVTAAIIGLVLVMASYAITQFVFKSVSGQGGAGGGGGGAACCVLCVATECTRTPIDLANAQNECRGNAAAGVIARVEDRSVCN